MLYLRLKTYLNTILCLLNEARLEPVRFLWILQFLVMHAFNITHFLFSFATIKFVYRFLMWLQHFFCWFGADIFQLPKYALRTKEHAVSNKVEIALGDTILRSVERMLWRAFGGCPKRKMCSFYQIESKTCIHGPYLYCGRYRSTVNQKNKTDITTNKLLK